MTTSFLCSTRRLAFSITISATWTWRLAGSSKVEEMTSPFTERCMSVTSSGRSSISSTIRNTSGWLSVIALAMFCRSTVLPVRGGATISARWPLPCGAMMSITRADLSLIGRIGAVERQLLVGIERRQIVEIDAVADRFGIVEIDLGDAGQSEIALAVLGPADLALDGVAGAQAEFADLVGRDVDVVGAGEIIGLGRAQEAEAVVAAPRSCPCP